MSRIVLSILVATVLCGGATDVLSADAESSPFDGLSYDEKIVATTILWEAQGEGTKGMTAVSCVIRQRVIERELSAVEVCLQRKQFSCWNGVKRVSAKEVTRNAPAAVVSTAIKLAKDLVAGEGLDRKLVGYANHYHTRAVKPSWSKSKKPVAVIGNHKFFRL